MHVEVEVASFYPAIATWLTKFVYSHTQSKIHVIVTHGFLRSLARLELEESAVGRFAPRSSAASAGRRTARSRSARRRGASSPRSRRRAPPCGVRARALAAAELAQPA